MYGARGPRAVDTREEFSLPHYGTMSRKPVYSGANDNNTRASRGKAIADEDTRLGSSRGSDLRVPSFSGAPGKFRGSVEHANRHRAGDNSRYATMTERRGFRDDSSLWKLGPGGDEAPLRAEGGGRFRDGLSSRGERVIRPAPYSDDGKLVRNGNYDDFGYDSGARSLRAVDGYAVTKNVSNTRDSLPGFIVECSRRLIAECSKRLGNFVLPIDDRRLEEQVGPTTKIFMFDRSARELHGVFQAESHSYRAPQGLPARVRVRVVKECLPLTERQFKGILHELYYDPINFSNHLTKEQVMKLLQTFGQVDTAHNVQASLPTSRRVSDSGLSQSSQEFHNISDETSYRKERWRRGTVDTRSLSGPYHSQEAARFSSKPPAQSLPAKAFDDLDDFVDDEGIEDLPVSTRLTTGSSPYSTSRGKQPSLRNLSGSRNLGLMEANWRDGVDPRDVLYRKRQALSPSPIDEYKRGGLSASPSWKDLHPMVEESVDELYDRPGKGVYKEESSYLSSRRRRHNDIDLNIPLEMGTGELSHLHDVKSKGLRRVWVNDEEEEKEYSVSPPKGALLRGSSSMPIPDHLLSPEALEDYDDDSRLDSRHMVKATRKEYGVLRVDEANRPVPSSYSNGKFQSRTVTTKNTSNNKPVRSPINRKRPVPARDVYIKEPSLRGAKAPVFKIQANLQTAERGRSERVVTMVNERVVTMMDKDNYRSGGQEAFGNGGSSSQGRKKKTSVWSRISLPGKGPAQKGLGPQGKGRVFSRLGPSVNSSFERRDDTYGHKNKKPRPQQTESEIEADSEGFDENIKNSPDALEGEDYLNDDHHAGESDKKMGKASNDLQGWTRKKASVVNSGDESHIPVHHGRFANANGGRRKLVRPSIGAPTLGGAEDTHAQHKSRSGSIDLDIATMEAQETGNTPRGSRRDLNSVADEYHYNRMGRDNMEDSMVDNMVDNMVDKMVDNMVDKMVDNMVDNMMSS